MKAAVLMGLNKPLVIEEIQLDPNCGPREVRLQVAASGLCHSDYHMITGDIQMPLPAVLGHEMAGIVTEVGAQVTTVKPGDHVVTCFSAYCGVCAQCIGGHTHRCLRKPNRRRTDTPRLTLNGKLVAQMSGLGGFAEQSLVHETAVVKMPPRMPLELAALLGCGVLTGFGAVVNCAQVQPRTTVAVIGCGGVGLNVIQAARLSGATSVIAIDRVPEKLEMARRFGATHALLGDDQTVKAVRDLSGGGVDHAFEVIGGTPTLQMAYAMLGMGGTLTMVGAASTNASLELPGLQLGQFAEKRILGTTMGSGPFQRDLPWLAGLYLDGRILLEELVSQRISLEAINAGFDAMLSGKVARSVIVFDQVLAQSRAAA